MRRDVIRTSGSGMSDSSIVITVPFFLPCENARGVPQLNSGTPCLAPGHGLRCASGDYIGHAAVDDQLNLVLDHQLAALEPRELQLVAGRLRREKTDSLVERAMLGLQRVKDADRIDVAHEWANSSIEMRIL